MIFIGDQRIKLEKPLNDLDRLVLRFVNILKKHVDYVIISGYVSLLLGRTRNTEDVDVYIHYLEFNPLSSLFLNLCQDGFECLNTNNVKEIYDYLNEGLAVRFALKGEVIPNFEVKFVKRIQDYDLFDEAVDVETEGGSIKISSLERQIAFKKYYLGSPKDLEDARYVEEVAKGHLNPEKIKKYQQLVKELMKE
ncbi:MAG: hypothetical protein V2A62_00795 [Candidatus Woesearchaeota archaeon]